MRAQPNGASPGVSHVVRLRLAALTVLLGLAAIVGRLAAPSDLWDQAQPRTVAYTVDILVHGGTSWILPRDADGLGATKPPLYNWIALPIVHLLGRTSDLAHRLPSLIALVATLALVVTAGERLARGVGWLAGLMLVACYPMLKLGTIARPDMLLILLLFTGFVAATALLASSAERPSAEERAPRTSWRGIWRAAFWGAIVAAAWTKGPAALLPPLYALAAARIVMGRFSASGVVGWWWGIPALLGAAAWPIAVWFIDSEHLRHQLWDEELLGRVLGSGGEGGGRGLMGILLGLPAMPAYFMIRFAPWSLVAIAAVAAIVSERGSGSVGRNRSRPAACRPIDRSTDLFLRGAVIWIALVLIVFSLSSGKRADYIAPAFPVAALVTAWWVVDSSGSRGRRVMPRAIALAAATATAIVAMVVAVAWFDSPLDSGGAAALEEIGRRARVERAAALDSAEPPAILTLALPAEHFPATIATGRPLDSTLHAVTARLDTGEAVLLFHERLNPDVEMIRRLTALEAAERLETRWSVDVPWKAADGVPIRNVTCTFVHARP